MYIGEIIKKGFEDAAEQNGEAFAFDKDLQYLSEELTEECFGDYRRTYEILEAATIAASSEEQKEIDKLAKKYTKSEILFILSKAAFLAGATWALQKTAGEYKPPRERTHCPLCGSKYD